MGFILLYKECTPHFFYNALRGFLKFLNGGVIYGELPEIKHYLYVRIATCYRLFYSYSQYSYGTVRMTLCYCDNNYRYLIPFYCYTAKLKGLF